MAVYAIGDVQGCADSLEKLLNAVHFTPADDCLWLCGDLVNRGRYSLETLRLVKSLKTSAVAVLGNHDLHLLAVAAGCRQSRDDDTLDDILRASDGDELLDWLRRRPLVHIDDGAQTGMPTMMMHAGIYPGWDADTVGECAAEVEALLRGDDYRQFLKRMYGDDKQGGAIGKWQRARFITNALTRIRFCAPDGTLDFARKGSPHDARPIHDHDDGNGNGKWLAWFDHPKMKCQNWRIVFGHWSALGFMQRDNLLCLDSGCVWGGELTAVQLDGEGVWRVKCEAV